MLAVSVHLVLDAPLGLWFDLVFVVVCVGAALWVHPRDFFTVGVLPPLLMTVVVLTLVAIDRSLVARADDITLQAIVSGLAHRAIALAVGYGLALGILGLRQVAVRNHGTLRRPEGARPRKAA